MLEVKRSLLGLGAAVAVSVTSLAYAADTTPSALVERYAAEAGMPSQALAAPHGESLFRTERVNGKGEAVACATCHTQDPRQAGRSRVGKRIEPLAPSANAARFRDAAKVEKWFGRNCKDVLGRACTAQEKGEFIAWLMTVK